MRNHALLWSGTSASAVDLHPPGFTETKAAGVSGASQVGWGFGSATIGLTHALLWNGTAGSVVDLHPVGYLSSFAEDVDGNTQVGWGDGHALLWHGTAASIVDLHPVGYFNSFANEVLGDRQVGYGSIDANNNRALLWNGTAESVVDLHDLLADLPVTLESSYATGVSEAGAVVGWGYDTDSGNSYAIIWTPVPEPTTGALTCLALIGAGALRLRGARTRVPHVRR
jgi:hypothetical protein